MSSAPGTPTPDSNQGSDTPRQYMSFSINGHVYATPLSQVKEITPYHELNHMPHTPDCVEGLLDLRGSVLPVISLRTRMNLPKKTSHKGDTILIIDHNGSRLGFLVDRVESVITATKEQQAPVSKLLEGQNGVWVREILLIEDRVILVLEPDSLARISIDETQKEEKKQATVKLDDLEYRLDEDLRHLIEMAHPTADEKVVPQLKSVLTRSEEEVTKVLVQVESMLSCTDKAFTGLTQLKQEVAMSGIQYLDTKLTELDHVTNDVQNSVFDLINQLQFQDIVRQKLEKVLRHIHGMHNVISAGLN